MLNYTEKRGIKLVSFDNIEHNTALISENEYFKQFYNENALFKYDSNFFQLKYQPTLVEFELIENMHIDFSEKVGLNHVKFLWSENKGVTPEIIHYFEQTGYELNMLNLYSIHPDEFVPSRTNSNTEVIQVTEKSLPVFKMINYTEDLTIDRNYAKSMEPFYKKLFALDNYLFLMAYLNDEPAGSVILIESDHYIEIDDLFVVKEYRNQGIGTEIQKSVMELARQKQKEVILVADAEDTPKNMYEKQGYEYISYQIGAQYVFKSSETKWGVIHLTKPRLIWSRIALGRPN